MKIKNIAIALFAVAVFVAGMGKSYAGVDTALAQMMSDVFGNAGGWNNLGVNPGPTSSAGIYITVAPSATPGGTVGSSYGSVYQYQAVNNNSGTQKYLLEQGLLSATQTLGPMPVPTGSPLVALIECGLNGASDPNNTVGCNYIEGTPNAAPSAPPAATGFFGVATVAIAAGATSAGTITPLTANELVPSFPNGLVTTTEFTPITYVGTATTYPRITSGAGAPSGACVSPSIYLRTNGSSGSNVYVCTTSGTWNAIAGV